MNVKISKTARICPIVFTFMEEWSKNLSTENFERLIVPRIDRIQNSYVADEKVQASRVFLILDWLVRTSAPDWLYMAGMNDPARALRELPELSNTQLTPVLEFLGLTSLGRANQVLAETMLQFEQPQDWNPPLREGTKRLVGSMGVQEWSPSIKEKAQRLAASMGVVAALGAVVKLQRPALSLVAFRAANVSFNAAVVLLSSGAAPKEHDTIIGKELGIHKSAVDLLDKLLDFSG